MSMLFAALAFGRLVEKESIHTDEEWWTMWKKFQDLPEVADRRFYDTAEEHNKRFDIFKANMEWAHEFNQGSETITMGMTPFADMTREEFNAWLEKSNGFKPAKNSLKIPRNVFDKTQYDNVPDSMDWSASCPGGSDCLVTPIKNQGQCGSCWAFSTTGGIEGQVAKSTGKLSSFSEQELVDCSHNGGNNGCNGGLMDNGFTWIEENGLCYESAYPYEAADGTCRSSSCTSHVTVKSFVDIPQGDHDALKTACGTQGPISIAVDANWRWQMYSGGILSTCPTQLDHGVLLVGYGTDSGNSYWKVKNSWGASWGENGFIRLKGDADTCGLADSASYPVLA